MKVSAKVWVYAMGSYYAGEVTRVTPKGAEAKYTSGAGKERSKWFPLQANGGYAQKYLEEFPLVEIVAGAPKPQGSRGRKPEERQANIYAKAQARK